MIVAKTETPPQDDPKLTYLYINPASLSIKEGNSYQFTYRAEDQDHDPITVTPSWSMNKSDAGTINASGNFTAGHIPGTYTNAVRLSTGSLSVFARVIVYQSPEEQIVLDRVEILDTNDLALSGFSIDEGDSKQFKAKAYDTNGNDITAQTSFTWNVNNYAGTINSNGYFIASYNPGFYSGAINLIGTYNDQTDIDLVSVLINEVQIPSYLSKVEIIPSSVVLNQGSSYQFSARAYDQNNNLLTSGVSYSWAVVNSSGTINSTGVFSTGSVDGTFLDTVRVRASMEGNIHYDYATVIINPIIIQATLDRVDILPSSINLSPYQSFDFDAQAYDTNNSPMFNDITYSWSVIAGPGTVNHNGLFESISNGTAVIQVIAFSGSIQRYDTATVNISGGTIMGELHHVVIDPQTVYLEPGKSVDFNAQSYDVNGNSIYAAYTWNSTSGTAGSISQSGYFTANYTVGTYYNAVKVKAYRNGVERYDYADVIVRESGDNYTFNIKADLHVVDENGGLAYPLDILQYTLTVTNKTSGGTANRLHNIYTTLDLPDYVSFISVTSATGGAGISSRTITWEAGTLQYGESKTLNLRVRINEDIPKGKIISAKAYVNADQLDSGLWVYANDITVIGGTASDEPLTPTGAWQWVLAAIVAMLATVLTRQLFRTRQLLNHYI